MAELNHYEKLVDMLRRPTMYKDIPMLSEIADDIEGLLAACDNYSDTIKELVDELEKVERKRGKWKYQTMVHESGIKANGVECSICGATYNLSITLPDMMVEALNFCPNCGADMRGGEDGTI